MGVKKSNEKEEVKKLKFRNYTPKDPDLKKLRLPKPQLPILQDHVKDILQQAEEAEKAEGVTLNLAPKKPNWDLKRDVEKKLDKLTKMTQRAIRDIMKAKMQDEESSDDDSDDSSGSDDNSSDSSDSD
eukprot:GFYU01009430.1.p2 GENE.GFYU01009430.1~~GFYU01009430.1.p2  ORF type:complete len:128 (-),score=52.26 GFYU01009430.1:521-904(-)